MLLLLPRLSGNGRRTPLQMAAGVCDGKSMTAHLERYRAF